MSQRYDLAVIGTGPAGGLVARLCAQSGQKVAVTDSNGYGGTCPLRGCEPKKVLVDAANAVARVNQMTGNGLIPGAAIDWPALQRFKRTFVDPTPGQVEESLKRAGVATLHGRARFVGPTALEVEGRLLEAGKVVVAAGAEPARLDLPGRELLAGSEDFLNLEKLPGSLIFVGGGYISFELAHVSVRAGARATILHRSRRPLKGFDPDLVGLLLKACSEMGLEVVVEAQVTALEREGEEIVVRTGPQGEKDFRAGMVVHGAGRRPALEGLDLEAAGVEATEKGIVVNEFYQSVSNSRVYAAGDVIDRGYPLTPTAVMEAEACAHNILKGNSKSGGYLAVPSVVFTDPPLARVGLSQDRAREEGRQFRTAWAETGDWDIFKRLGQRWTGYKVLIETNTDRILGAHLLGHGAEEVINLFALAIRYGLTATQLKETVCSYPSHGYELRHMLA